jgi:hypothetical protein
LYYLKLFLYCSLLTCFCSEAKQLDFNKAVRGDSYLFDYSWLDQKRQKQSLSFSLPKEAIFERFRNFKAYKADFSQQSVNKAVHQQLKKNRLRGVQVIFPKNKDDLTIQIRGPNREKVNEAYNKIASMQTIASDAYLSDNFYQKFTTYDQIQAIKPDHVRFANETVPDLKPIKPLLLEKVSIKNIREATNYILSFVQTIPYSTLESRVTSSGAGFIPPIKLLWENQGDCDSKVTLAASLLRTLMPRIKMILVFIDKHALIGIDIRAKKGEETIKIGRVEYVLAEPTGPALYPLGQIAPDSKKAIDNGHYITENYHSIPKKVSIDDLPEDQGDKQSEVDDKQ